MGKIKKRIIIALSVILGLGLIGGLVAGNFFYNLALLPSSNKSDVLSASHNKIEGPPGYDEIREANKQWFKEIQPQDQWMTSYDQLQLHSYVIPQPQYTNQWVIICHGYTGAGKYMTGAARHFYERGYNVLLPDARGHGESAGNYIGMGWHDRLDLVAWAEGLAAQDQSSQIVLYGVSMGAATVLMASGEALPSNVKAVVEDCGYTSAKEEFKYQMKQLYGLPAFPILDFSSLVARLRAGYFLGEASALVQVEKSKTPTLFIHGTEDTFVPSFMVEQLYEAAPVEKQLYLVEGAGHGLSSAVAGDAYWAVVWDFLGPYIKE